MSSLDWIAVLGMATGFLLFIVAFSLFLIRVEKGHQLKVLTRIQSKNNYKKKKLRRKKIVLHNKRSTLLFRILVLSVFSGGSIALSFYTMNYQASNLSRSEQHTISTGYYLVRDVEERLADEVTDDEESETIDYLKKIGVQLAAFSLKKGDNRLSKDGQQTINRYYAALKDLGMTMNSQLGDSHLSPEKLEHVREAIDKVKRNEGIVVKEFRIDESILEERFQ